MYNMFLSSFGFAVLLVYCSYMSMISHSLLLVRCPPYFCHVHTSYDQ